MKKRLYAWLTAAVFGCVVIGYGLHACSVEGKRNTTTPDEPAMLSPEQTQGARLGEKLSATRQIEEICAFYMDAPEHAYHFIRTEQGVELDGEAADAYSFDCMLELMFAIPVHSEARTGDAAEAELSLTLTYTDGAQSSVSICISGENAWMELEDGQQLRTDAWRIHALMLACDGARLSE